MRLADHANRPLELELVIGAFVSQSHPCQEVGMLVNERVVTRQSPCLGNGEEEPLPYKFMLGPELLLPDEKSPSALLYLIRFRRKPWGSVP